MVQFLEFALNQSFQLACTRFFALVQINSKKFNKYLINKKLIIHLA